MSILTRLLFPEVSIDEQKASLQLNGKTVLITGATFGIGESLTRHLFQYSVHLILVARTVEKLQLLEEESRMFKANVTILRCDFYSEESIKVLCEKLKPIRIDFFVSNAGKSVMRSLMESQNRLHDFQRTIAVNYLAPIQLILALIEPMKEAKTHVVNVSTYNVLMKSPPFWSAYVSSKKAMHSWVESNATELASLNISVSNVYFPLIESRMKAANKSYERTPAMSMTTAVAILMKSLLNRQYQYKPWWHVPFQLGLFLLKPFWNSYWHGRIRQRK